MDLTIKSNNIIKTKNYLKNIDLWGFFNGVNRVSGEWNAVEQKLKKLNFCYYKIFNKTSKRTLKNSIYTNTSETINGITFILKPTIALGNELNKILLLNDFEVLLFIFLSLKLNNKIYNKTQIKHAFFLNYKSNKLLFFQFGLTSVKLFCRTKNLK